MQAGRCRPLRALPGDPARARRIAEQLEDARLIAENREYVVFTGKTKGVEVSVCSTGIGGSSAAIALEELRNVGAEVFIRVGSAGGRRKDIPIGSLVVVTAAYRGDGVSDEYLPLGFPAVADLDVNNALIQAAKELGYNAFTGIGTTRSAYYARHPELNEQIAAGRRSRGGNGSVNAVYCWFAPRRKSRLRGRHRFQHLPGKATHAGGERGALHAGRANDHPYRAASGAIAGRNILMEFDDLLVHARIADVFRYRLFEGWIGIRDGRFVAVEAGAAPPASALPRPVDLAGRIVMPGLIDSHLHIESSLLTPRRFAEAVLPFGTTTILSDPHEVGNVAGEDGVKWMIAASQDLPLRIYHSIPSCVPATSPEIEWTHEVFDAATIRRLARQPSVIALGEVMDYRGLLGPNERLRAIVGAARENNSADRRAYPHAGRH